MKRKIYLLNLLAMVIMAAPANAQQKAYKGLELHAAPAFHSITHTETQYCALGLNAGIRYALPFNENSRASFVAGLTAGTAVPLVAEPPFQHLGVSAGIDLRWNRFHIIPNICAQMLLQNERLGFSPVAGLETKLDLSEKISILAGADTSPKTFGMERKLCYSIYLGVSFRIKTKPVKTEIP